MGSKKLPEKSPAKIEKNKRKLYALGLVALAVLLVMIYIFVVVSTMNVGVIYPYSSENKNLALSNCVYDSFSDYIACDTNCHSLVTGNTTTFIAMDKNGNISVAMDGSTAIGTITLTGGKLTAKPADSFIGTKLSKLDHDTLRWVVSLSCQNPVGTGTTWISGEKI